MPRLIITDLTVYTLSSETSSCPYVQDSLKWHRIEKELYLHTSQQEAWLYVSTADEEELAATDLLVVDIRVSDLPPIPDSCREWESRPGGIWLLRSCGSTDKAVREVDILFGTDAVDPRPQWTLMRSPLRLDGRPDFPARLSVRHSAKPDKEVRPTLRVKKNGKFKIVQISDTHMVIGVGVCRDGLDAEGKDLPESEADPLTIDFSGKVLDVEKPDLVILTGDQLHHDIPDSQSALFKVVAPIIERSTPFAAVFGNHDSEGTFALERMAQMSILQNLPFSLCEPGPAHVDGVGNFSLQILAPAPSKLPLSTLYFLDSHGQIPSSHSNPDYDHIKQSQIDWFSETCQAQRKLREKDDDANSVYLSLAFFHIPLPEFGDHRLIIHSGHRREPTEGPSFNSHFYDTLLQEGISAVGCGHDHVNDFCALLPPRTQQVGDRISSPGLWLCHGGGSGFGGYCSYGGVRFHRRVRVWEIDTRKRNLKTWMRVEYALDRVDELVLVESGVVNAEG